MRDVFSLDGRRNYTIYHDEMKRSLALFFYFFHLSSWNPSQINYLTTFQTQFNVLKKISYINIMADQQTQWNSRFLNEFIFFHYFIVSSNSILKINSQLSMLMMTNKFKKHSFLFSVLNFHQMKSVDWIIARISYRFVSIKCTSSYIFFILFFVGRLVCAIIDYSHWKFRNSLSHNNKVARIIII